MAGTAAPALLVLVGEPSPVVLGVAALSVVAAAVIMAESTLVKRSLGALVMVVGKSLV